MKTLKMILAMIATLLASFGLCWLASLILKVHK